MFAFLIVLFSAKKGFISTSTLFAGHGILAVFLLKVFSIVTESLKATGGIRGMGINLKENMRFIIISIILMICFYIISTVTDKSVNMKN